MSTMTHVLGSLTSFNLVNNLQGLVNDTCKPLGGGASSYVDNSSLKYPSANLYFKIYLPTSGLVPGGALEFYIVKCLITPGTQANWSANINPGDTNDVSGSIFNIAPFLRLKADADMGGGTVICYVLTDLAFHKFQDIDGTIREVGELPPYWSILCWNKCGNTLLTSTHVAQFQLRSYGSV
jgi:hypothetical protein